MEVHSQELSDVTRYIEKHRHVKLEDYQLMYDATMKVIGRYITPGPDTPILEIGTGPGWYPCMCRINGIHCEGLDISQQLVDFGAELARQHGLEPSIRLGNVEQEEIGDNLYKIVVCNSVFEHIEYWRPSLRKIFKSMKPGGIFVFSSTNRFSFISTEYDFPLYGWLPDKWRYALRVKRQGPDIMKLGIDFNQFTYPQLRKEFREVGFTEIYDLVDLADPQSPLKKAVVNAARATPLIKWPVLTFNPATVFVCRK